MIGYIYILKDNLQQIRYVGQTRATLKRRLQQHINGAKRGSNTYSARWIRNMLADGYKPIMEVLETLDNQKDLDEREMHYISMLREKGCKLTNTCKGGSGTYHINRGKWTIEHKQAISNGLKKYYEACKAKGIAYITDEQRKARATNANTACIKRESKTKQRRLLILKTNLRDLTILQHTTPIPITCNGYSLLRVDTNKWAKVDNEDYIKASLYHWRTRKHGKGKGILLTKIAGKEITLSRLLQPTDIAYSMSYFANGDKMDYRKHNLVNGGSKRIEKINKTPCQTRRKQE